MEGLVPTEQEANDAVEHFLRVMPGVSKAVDSLSKKQLKRLLLSLLKHPLEPVITKEDDELALLNVMFSLVNSNLIAMQRAVHVSQTKKETVNEQA